MNKIIFLCGFFLTNVFSNIVAAGEQKTEFDFYKPYFGFYGTRIYIEGKNFSPDKSLYEITIGGVPAEIKKVIIEGKEGKIVAFVPDGAKPGKVKVKTGNIEKTFEKDFYFIQPNLSSGGIFFIVLGWGLVSSLLIFSIVKVMRSKGPFTE